MSQCKHFYELTRYGFGTDKKKKEKRTREKDPTNGERLGKKKRRIVLALICLLFFPLHYNPPES